jgi:glucose/arabinose dehydrogenase
VSLTVTPIAHGFSEPTDLAVAPDGRVLVAERVGRVRVVRDGQLVSAPVVSIPDVDSRGSGGLLAIALDPDFARAPFLYALFTASTGFQLVRFRVFGDTASDRAVILDRIGTSASRPFAALRFGPDRKLYLAIDDGGDPRAGGNLGSFSGKVLRLNADGTTPRDQMGGSPIFATDVHRPCGLDWDTSGTLWVVEPDVASAFVRDGAPLARGTLAARHRLASRTAATGLLVLRSDLVPQLKDNLLLGSAEGLLRARAQRPPLVFEPLFQSAVRAIAAAGDGEWYLATTDALTSVRVGPPNRTPSRAVRGDRR